MGTKKLMSSIYTTANASAITMRPDQASSAGTRRGKTDHPGRAGADHPGKPIGARSLS